MASGLRLIVYDATQRQRRPRALGFSWQYGTHLYRALGRVDGAHGAHGFDDALIWLSQHQPSEPISEVQFWGHGKWGRIFIANEVLDRGVLTAGHRHQQRRDGGHQPLTDGEDGVGLGC